MSEVLVCLPCGLAYPEDSGYQNCPRCKKPLTKARKVRKTRMLKTKIL